MYVRQHHKVCEIARSAFMLGDLRVARVHVIALVVHAEVGLTLGLIAHVIIVVFVVAFP